MSNHRSKPLRESAKGEPCAACGTDNGTTVWCHGNEQIMGKGQSIKAHDLIGFYGCSVCHHFYDRGCASREDKRDFFREAFLRSMIRVAEKLAAGSLKL